MKKRSFAWVSAAIAAFAAIAIGVRLYRPPGGAQRESDTPTAETPSGLTLRNVTLEQQDENGQLLWKVDADEVTYSADQEVADLVNPEGELYQQGELLYRVKADKGIIQQNGQIILLEGNIVATGIQNEMVINGQNLVWQPQQNLMVVSNGITGEHPQVRAKAREARIYDAEKRMELEGEVVATSVVEDPKVEPWLKMQGEIFEWKWEEETITSDRPLRVERFENEQITQAVSGQKGQVNLAEEQATLEGSVQAQLLTEKLNMSTNKALWDVSEQTIQAREAVQVVNNQQQVTVTAREGDFDLEEQVAYFRQDVVTIAARNNGRLTSNQLTWNLNDQTVLAEGNVNYQQTDPQLNIQGPRATGRIEAQTVLIDGGNVVTEIVPPTN